MCKLGVGCEAAPRSGPCQFSTAGWRFPVCRSWWPPSRLVSAWWAEVHAPPSAPVVVQAASAKSAPAFIGLSASGHPLSQCILSCPSNGAAAMNTPACVPAYVPALCVCVWLLMFPRHGHQQAQCPLCGPHLRVQVTGEPVPGEWPCRQGPAACPLCSVLQVRTAHTLRYLDFTLSVNTHTHYCWVQLALSVVTSDKQGVGSSQQEGMGRCLGDLLEGMVAARLLTCRSVTSQMSHPSAPEQACFLVCALLL